MPCGPSPAMSLAAESLPQAISECMESLIEAGRETADSDSDSSCSSLETWDCDSDTGPENSEASIRGMDSLDAELEQSGGAIKRRRLAGATDCSRSGNACRPRSVQQAIASEVNFIIFDWDDTLMPSTWLQQQGLAITPGSALPSDEQKEELHRVSRCVIRTLRRAKRLGHVMILTNAEKGWVELACSKFLPEVAPLLEGVKILSARSTFEQATVVSPLSPLLWKRQAFSREIAAFLQRPTKYATPDCQKHMISVGDSMQERTALMESTVDQDCWAKSLKLLERPSPAHLVKQHRLLCSCLRSFIDYEGSLDLCLQVPS